MSGNWRFVWLMALAVLLVSGANWLSSDTRTPSQESFKETVAHLVNASRLLDEIK